MAKVISYVDEQDVGFMEDIEVEFVSLVSHAANRTPWKIIKSEEGKMPKKNFYQLLVSKDVGEETINETIKNYELEVQSKDEESLDGFNVLQVNKDENLDLEQKSVAKLDDNIFAVVAPVKDENELKSDKEILKEMDYATMDNVAESLFAMADVVLGTLHQPEGTPANKKNAIINAVENFKKYAEAVLMNSKSEDVIDLENIEVKGENLEPLFYQVNTEKDADLEKQERQEEVANEVEKRMKEAHEILEQTLDTFKEKVTGMVEEKAEEKFSAMKTSLNDELVEKLEVLTEKEEFEAKVKELADGIEELKNTTKQRKSEVDEEVPTTNTKSAAPKSNRPFTFKTLA